MRDKHTLTGIMVLSATSLVSAVLGSIHAFSVFLHPLEVQFDATRSAVSLTYSLALVALTFAVLVGPRIYGRWSAASLILGACVLAASGALLAGVAGSLWGMWLGYSLIFGLANGVGYGFGLQLAAQYMPGREGLAMGVVTASYALGAVLSPGLFDLAVSARGVSAAMMALAGTLLLIGLLSATLLRLVKAQFNAPEQRRRIKSATGRSQVLLWIGYFGGVLAGLMVIGHAAGIAAALRPELAPWIAPVIIAACNLVGSLVGGRLADRVSLGALLATLAFVTSATLALLAAFGQVGGIMVGFGVVGFAYGGTIAAYPAAVAKLFGMHDSAEIYGRIFTAWGCAGLLGPWLAGLLFDWRGDYQIALLTAAGAGVISVAAIGTLFRNDRKS